MPDEEEISADEIELDDEEEGILEVPEILGDGVPEPDVEIESLDDALAKKEPVVEEDDEEDSVLSLSREERLEPLAAKVVPPQPTEFVCKKCFLVKHRSQLKDRSKSLCRDCA